MRKVKVKLTAPTILQVDAGEHEAVRDGGKLYILMQEEDGFETSSGTPTKTEPKKQEDIAKPEPVKEATATKEVAKEVGSKNYTEAEMMDISTDGLLDILDEKGIDPNKFDGKNTHKKLRLLILDAQKGKVVDDTQKASARHRREEPEEEARDEMVEIPEDEWENLKEGDLVLAKLNMDGEDGEKIWEAEVVGWKTPKGGRIEKLHLLFTEDNQEDYLRDGDKLFEFQESL